MKQSCRLDVFPEAAVHVIRWEKQVFFCDFGQDMSENINLITAESPEGLVQIPPPREGS